MKDKYSHYWSEDVPQDSYAYKRVKLERKFIIFIIIFIFLLLIFGYIAYKSAISPDCFGMGCIG